MPHDNEILQNFAVKVSSKSGRIPEDLLSVASNTCQTFSNNEDVESITLMASQWEPQYLKNVAKFINENKGESLSSSSVIALIKKQFEMNLHTIETFIEDLKSRAGEDVKIHEDLKVWKMFHSGVKSSVTEENLQAVLKKLLEMGMLDLFSTTQETDEELNHAEETSDGSSEEIVLANLSLGGDTEGAQKIKKGKEKNRGEKN